jgi:hypothetical protein
MESTRHKLIVLAIDGLRLALAGLAAMSVIFTFVSILYATVLSGAEPGKVTGVATCSNACLNQAVWLVTGDCHVSYLTTEFQQGRFVFSSIPPGTYRIVGSSDIVYALPSPEFHVAPGETVNKDVYLSGPPLVDGDTGRYWTPTIIPLNGRVVDEEGNPIMGVTVTPMTGLWPYNLSEHPANSVSDSDGRFGFCAVTQRRHVLLVEHPGYRTRKLKLTVGAFNYSNGQLEIKLRKR